MQHRAAFLLIAATMAVVVPPPLAQDDPRDPKALGLVETAESRLAQIDVTVIGPPERVRDLTAEDFRIRVNFLKVTGFEVDRLCGPAVANDDSGGPSGEAEPSPVAAVAPGAIYLFYFDQPHLTLAGRQRALDVARELVELIISDGNRAMIVSNAARLKIVEPLTSDADAVLAALERLEQDRAQWDVYAENEDLRIDDVVRLLNTEGNVRRAISRARLYQREERWRTEQNLRRLELTLGRLREIESTTKSVIYFADTLRSNPGEHYVSFFGAPMQHSSQALGAMATDGLSASNVFDRVVNQAAIQGIRVYTVEARGLVNQIDMSGVSGRATTLSGGVSTNSRVRMRDAQDSLANLASETGGHAFLHGVRGARIAERVLDDSSCLYLLSFDPARYREDVPYRISVKVARSGVEVRSRGRILFPSQSSRLTARLLHAFGSPSEIEDPLAVRVGLVPVEFEDGAYSALLQISLPGTTLQGASWDLGATMTSADKVREEVSGRVRVNGPGVPVILEQEIRFKPGEYGIVSVAHETRTGLVTSDEITIDWPAPRDARAVLSPIVLVQPVPGAFMRDGEIRRRGSLAHREIDALKLERPTALIGLVCHSRRQKGALQVERRLTGRLEQSFDPLLLDLDDDRCAQVRDLLPADSLVPGYYRYEVRVIEDGELLQQRSREFFVERATSIKDIHLQEP